MSMCGVSCDRFLVRVNVSVKGCYDGLLGLFKDVIWYIGCVFCVMCGGWL